MEIMGRDMRLFLAAGGKQGGDATRDDEEDGDGEKDEGEDTAEGDDAYELLSLLLYGDMVSSRIDDSLRLKPERESLLD